MNLVTRDGRQFISRLFKQEAVKHSIKLIYGEPHNPKGRGKVENYHRALYRELISLKEFGSLSHFRRELWRFDRQYNHWRKQEALSTTPANIYNNERYFNNER